MPQVDIPPQDNNNPDNPQNELLAGKYKTEEDLQKGILEALKKQHNGDLVAAYKTLESQLGKSTSQQMDTQDTGSENKDDKSDTTSDANTDLKIKVAKETVENAGLNFEKYQQEFLETGNLSEDSIKELESKGISKEIIDTYLAGFQALVTQQKETIFNLAGGEDSYKKIVEWASKNLSEDEIEAYNNAISGDLSAAKFAVTGLVARYKSETGSLDLFNGGQNSGADGAVYQSIAELKRDMENELYKTDPAFRKQVMDKLARSNIL